VERIRVKWSGKMLKGLSLIYDFEHSL
jgi:hypothetical protein